MIWLADLQRWAAVVAHYLKPGGIFLLIDSHPVSVLFEETTLNYFSKEPERLIDSPDYCVREHRSKNESVEWQHTIANILNALIRAGLTIEKLGEYDFCFYPVKEDWIPKGDGYWYPPSGPTPYPMILLVRARKT
ncbi:MAG: hypothetical protein AB1644_05230 [Candidatus Zixiibacteriota bacterium]